MTFTEIEDKAMVADVMPDGLHLSDYRCYQALCSLYHRVYSGQIGKAQAQLEKKQIYDAYGRDSMSDRIGEENLRRERRLRGLCLEIQQNGTEREKRLLRILDGSERAFESKV